MEKIVKRFHLEQKFLRQRFGFDGGQADFV